MVEIKKMAECKVDESVQAWNTGFEGYFFDMTTTPEAFEKRGRTEGLSDELSVVAFEEGVPVGLVRNGVRQWQGKKVAWNGGTGVGRVQLFEKRSGEYELVDDMRAATIGCEFGEYGE